MVASSGFDVFLCHNSEDKDAVIEIANQLKSEYQIKPWLDDWELVPGLPWQRELEKQINQIKSAAVFIGHKGIGPWQNAEIDAFLREFKRRECPVIPVLLRDAPQKPTLPIFLQGMTWVDFREQTPAYTDPMYKLVWGITGQKPEQTVTVAPQTSDDLSSEKGVDYTRLRDLLKAGNWKHADDETYFVMLACWGRTGGRIINNELSSFPCTDLRTIDQLWVKYSNGRFGFSVQKKIWLEVGKNNNAFCTYVGWDRNAKWLGGGWVRRESINYDGRSAKVGHLPSTPIREDWGYFITQSYEIPTPWNRRFISYLASRFESCNL